MPKTFDYSFLWKGSIPAQLVQLAQGVQVLKSLSSLRSEGHARLYGELEKIARVQSVKSSNALEGIITTDDRISAIVTHGCAPLNHAEEEIAGYRDALALIHRDHASMQVNGQTVLHLHGIMQRFVGGVAAGCYKQDDNLIVEQDEAGNRSIRFSPSSAADTPRDMEQMFLAFQEASARVGENMLLLIPCLVLDFLCIHPFADGNGRVSRLLTLLLLYRAGFDVGRFISLEEQINQRKGLYYRALKESSQGWHDNTQDYFPFVGEFLATLFLCYKELDKRFAIIRTGKVNKTQRIEAAVLDSLIPVSKAELCALLPDISPSTVEAVLGKMVRAGRIRRLGSPRSARYAKLP